MAKQYSIDAERTYYGKAETDRRALPYGWLSSYVTPNLGNGLFRGRDVLDLGAGEGVYAAYLADVANARTVVAFDLTPHRMRTDYRKTIPNLHFVSGDLFRLPFPDGSFDVVFMNLVLHHIRFNLRDALLGVRDVMRSGGQLVAIEPNVYNPAASFLHWWHERSANEGFLSRRRVSRVLADLGFVDLTSGFFWKDRKWARNPLLGSCFWISARKTGGQC